MSSALSDDEFQRMQSQLIELRTANYELDNRCRKLNNEFLSVKEKCAGQDKELQKCNRIIAKSKKTREVEELLHENASLSLKLQSQEDEFRLQNNTLLQELARLVEQNEALEQRVVDDVSPARPKDEPGGATAELQSEVWRLQAENQALRKNLTEVEAKSEQDMAELKEKIKVLGDVNTMLEGRCTRARSRSRDDTTDDAADAVPHVLTEGATDVEEDANTSLMDLVSQSEEKVERLEMQLRDVSALSLQFDTAKEENRILQESMQASERLSREQVSSLEEEVGRMQEKLRKKQESFVKLQEEKEQLYTESKQQQEELQTTREKETSSLRQQNDRLHSKINELHQTVQELREKVADSDLKLQNALSNLHEQMNSNLQETCQALEEQKRRLQGDLAAVESRLTDSQSEVGKLKVQTEELTGEKASLEEKLEDVEEERDGLNKMYAELNKVAEKRKSLLDDLAIRLQQNSDDHMETVTRIKQDRDVEIDELGRALLIEKGKTADLARLKERGQHLQEQTLALESSKVWLQRRLEEVEQTAACEREVAAMAAMTVAEQHRELVAKATLEHELNLQDVNVLLDKARRELEERESAIGHLRQKGKDASEDRKIHDRKASLVVKDLKRQLVAERRRAERLQEKLQELLSDSQRGRGSMEELFQPAETTGGCHVRGDSGSVSSWSMVSGGVERTNQSRDDNRSPAAEPSSPGVIEEENAELMRRVATLQKGNSELRERVSHLETSSGGMVEDLMEKTAIIEHYIMNGRIDQVHHSPSHDNKLRLKNVVDFVKNKTDDSTKELNKKLQKMLEETLTKNIHLQQDVEHLSQKLMEASQSSSVVSVSSPEHPSASTPQ